MNTKYVGLKGNRVNLEFKTNRNNKKIIFVKHSKSYKNRKANNA